jgi:hypothetical protein
LLSAVCPKEATASAKGKIEAVIQRIKSSPEPDMVAPIRSGSPDFFEGAPQLISKMRPAFPELTGKAAIPVVGFPT